LKFSHCGLVVAALSLSSAFAQAQGSPVVITATRLPTRVNDVVAEVTLIDRATIERAQGRTLSELLAQQAGLQFSSNGGLGKFSSVFMRGLEARHTLLLVDGVAVGSATVGTPSLDNIPLAIIDRIEIVRGPLSSVYGSGAVGGVIQVFTRTGAMGLQPNASVTVGSHRHGQAVAGVAAGEGAYDAAVQVQHTETRGISATNERVPFGSYNPDNDGWRQNSGTLRLGWALSPRWRVEALALKSQGTTQLDDGPGADARAELSNQILLLAARGQVMAGWGMRLSVSNAVDRYDTLSSASAFASLGATEGRQRTLSWENSFDTPIGALLALAERQHQGVSRPGTSYVVSDRDIDGLALGLNGKQGAHSWQASVRNDHNSQFGGKTTGALGYGYALSPAWRLGASLGTSFVAPSFNQLYYPGFGTPTLLPEQGRHAELSARWTAGEHSLRAAWFSNHYRGFITSGPQPVNLPRAESDGVTLSYEGQWQDLAVAASIDHVDPRNASVGNSNFDKQLPRRAKDSARLNLRQQWGLLSVGALLNLASHRYDDSANKSRLGGYGTLDLQADYALAREWTLGARLNNLSDKRFETALGYNQPGRELFVSLRYEPPR